MSFTLRIQHWQGKKSVKMIVEPDDLVEEVIGSLADHWKDGPYGYVLYLGRRALPPDTRVRAHGLSEGAVLEYAPLRHAADMDPNAPPPGAPPLPKQVAAPPAARPAPAQSKDAEVLNWLADNVGLDLASLSVEGRELEGGVSRVIVKDKSDGRRYKVWLSPSGEVYDFTPG